MTTKPRLTIKPHVFKHQQMEPDYAQKTWQLLRTAISEIHDHNAGHLSFEELYRNAYNMVLHKYGDLLYSGLEQVVNEHLKEVSGGVDSEVEDELFLSALHKAWTDHKRNMLMIRDILMYMDRVYVKNKQVQPVYELGLTLFCKHVTRSSKVKSRLQDCLLELIHRERQGELIDRALVKSLTQMLVDVGINKRSVYEQDFEAKFLTTSADFYRLEAREFIASNSCSDYMIKAEQRLREESERVQHYLDPLTESKIREVVERELITVHMDTLIGMEQSGLVAMLRDNKLADLQRMYRLFGRVPEGHHRMRECIAAHLVATGEELVAQVKTDKQPLAYIEGLLEMKVGANTMLATAFDDDTSFHNSTNRAFEKFINAFSRSPEFLSLYIDKMLKRGSKGATEDELEQVLTSSMEIFRYLEEKDVFEKYYKQHLAGRLLGARSVSDDAERNMIQKLKTECGYQFTSKLEGMFTDMRISADMMTNFREIDVIKNKLGGVDLAVQILTTGYWPTSSSAACILPPEVMRCCDVFKQFYLSCHTGRRLTWQTSMGTGEVKARFPNGAKHELIVSTAQMCILMLYNDTDVLTVDEISAATNITGNSLKRSLLTLSLGKHKVLRKQNKNKDLPSTEEFRINAKFSSKLFKIKVLSMSSKGDTVDQVDKSRKGIDEDRKHHIEAAIVRVMKARKQLDHVSLVTEVTQQLSSRFMPNPQAVKKRIESLIEREYLERHKKDRKVYNYLA